MKCDNNDRYYTFFSTIVPRISGGGSNSSYLYYYYYYIFKHNSIWTEELGLRNTTTSPAERKHVELGWWDYVLPATGWNIIDEKRLPMTL